MSLSEVHLLPEVHHWWPHLSARAKQQLEDAQDGVIPDEVRREIERILGASVDDAARLGEGDRAFIRTQGEAVD